MVVDLGAVATVGRINFINYQAQYGVKKLEVSASDALTGPFANAQVFADLPSGDEPGNTGNKTRNHCCSVPDTDLVFGPALTGRFFRFQVLENHGSSGSGFYRMYFKGTSSKSQD
jgi:hypothetical protein